MRFKNKFLIVSISLLFSACSYLPTKTDPVTEEGPAVCQARCSRAGMMVDPNNPGCGCIRFPGK
jgi:hypothetical protein